MDGMMAIPEGTTARQIETLTRATLVGAIAVGMLTWWWPGSYAWGGLAGCLAVVLVLWLWRQTLADDRTVPGHPVHMVLLVPTGILAVHFFRTGLGRSVSGGGMCGAIDASMIYQISLAALAVVMMQGLLSRTVSSGVWVSVCGLAMVVGPLIAMIPQTAAPIAEALAMQALAGAAVWLSPIWTAERACGAGRRGMVTVRLAVAAAGVGAVLVIRPASAGVAGVVAAGGGILAGAVLSRIRVVRAVCWVAVAVSVSGGAALCLDFAAAGPSGADFWIGRGERALMSVPQTASGVRVAVGAIGWVGALVTMAVAVVCLVWVTAGARGLGARRRVGVAAWTVAAVLGGASVVARGGAFLPSGLLAAALTWSMLPAAAGRRQRRRGGVVLLAAFLALAAMLGLGRNPGLAQWSVEAFGGSENMPHLPGGFLLATLLAWLVGRGRLLWGLGMIAAAAAAGGLAELIQGATAARGVEMTDWALHTAGCAAAGVMYVLCIAARGCESSRAGW